METINTGYLIRAPCMGHRRGRKPQHMTTEYRSAAANRSRAAKPPIRHRRLFSYPKLTIKIYKSRKSGRK